MKIKPRWFQLVSGVCMMLAGLTMLPPIPAYAASLSGWAGILVIVAGFFQVMESLLHDLN